MTMKMTQEMMEHISSATWNAAKRMEEAYALGINDGHSSQRDEHNAEALSSARNTIKQQDLFATQLSKLVFDHKSLDARMLCLDHGWCINCYTYTCHGDCG